MAIQLGSTNFGSLYLGSTKIGEAYLGSVKVFGSSGPNYNPLNLPPYTMRIKLTAGKTPTFYRGSAVQVSSNPNIWDYTYENNNWGAAMAGQPELLEILGANLTGVTDMGPIIYGNPKLTSIALFDTRAATSIMMYDNPSLTTVPLFDLPNVTSVKQMFSRCTSLTEIPQLVLPSTADVSYMFYGCTNMSQGILSYYNYLSSQGREKAKYELCFSGCGSNTQSGQSDLAQIPVAWGGTSRVWENSYMFLIEADASNSIYVAQTEAYSVDPTVGGSVTITSGQYSTNGSSWTNLTSAECANINSTDTFHKTCKYMKLYFTFNSDIDHATYYTGRTYPTPSATGTSYLYAIPKGGSAYEAIGSRTWTQDNYAQVWINANYPY